MDTTAALDAYIGGSHALRMAVTDMSREQWMSRPIQGKWSVLEVVCHLADTDANIAHRIKRVLTEVRPEFDRVKPDQLLAGLSYHGRDLDEELAFIELTRRQVARILRNAPPEVWERAGIVNERGPRTVAQMVQGAIEHLRHHVQTIAEKRRALGLGDFSPSDGKLGRPAFAP